MQVLQYRASQRVICASGVCQGGSFKEPYIYVDWNSLSDEAKTIVRQPPHMHDLAPLWHVQNPFSRHGLLTVAQPKFTGRQRGRCDPAESPLFESSAAARLLPNTRPVASANCSWMPWPCNTPQHRGPPSRRRPRALATACPCPKSQPTRTRALHMIQASSAGASIYPKPGSAPVWRSRPRAVLRAHMATHHIYIRLRSNERALCWLVGPGKSPRRKRTNDVECVLLSRGRRGQLNVLVCIIQRRPDEGRHGTIHHDKVFVAVCLDACHLRNATANNKH